MTGMTGVRGGFVRSNVWDFVRTLNLTRCYSCKTPIRVEVFIRPCDGSGFVPEFLIILRKSINYLILLFILNIVFDG